MQFLHKYQAYIFYCTQRRRQFARRLQIPGVDLMQLHLFELDRIERTQVFSADQAVPKDSQYDIYLELHYLVLIVSFHLPAHSDKLKSLFLTPDTVDLKEVLLLTPSPTFFVEEE